MRSNFSRREFRHSIFGSGKNSGYTYLQLDGTTDFLSGFNCFSETASSEDCCTSEVGVLLDNLDTWRTRIKMYLLISRAHKLYLNYYPVQIYSELYTTLNFLATCLTIAM